MTDISTRTDWKSGAIAGLIAGLVFVIIEMVLVGTVGGGSPWGPPRMMAAIALGDSVLPPPGSFDAGIVTVGMIVHFALSAVLGILFALLIGRWVSSLLVGMLLGSAFGLAVYLVNFYGMTEIFPWFVMARNAITIVAHLVFGAVIGLYLAQKETASLEPVGERTE